MSDVEFETGEELLERLRPLANFDVQPVGSKAVSLTLEYVDEHFAGTVLSRKLAGYSMTPNVALWLARALLTAAKSQLGG